MVAIVSCEFFTTNPSDMPREQRHSVNKDALACWHTLFAGRTVNATCGIRGDSQERSGSPFTTNQSSYVGTCTTLLSLS